MTLSTGQRRHHFKSSTPADPAITPFAQWPTPNHNFHRLFYQWLKSGGYGPSATNTYCVAARLALGYLNKPYWMIDPEADLERVREHIAQYYASSSTRRDYNKGLLKLTEYLRLRQNRPARSRPLNWEHYLNGLPDWLREHVRDFIAHKQKGWNPEDRHRRTMETLSPLCITLRWMTNAAALKGMGDVTPQLWFDFMDTRLAEGIHPNTINHLLFRLKALLQFLDEAGIPICQRILLVRPFKTGRRIPKDAPVSQLRCLLAGIERETGIDHTNRRRWGIMDRAWVHLMLYSGLRTCEIRRLRLGDIDWESRRVRIEQSKGLKDRLAYLNSATVLALQAWLRLRGEVEYASDHVFLYCHRPLSRRYCHVRLRTYGRRYGARIAPHQLRHSCATLLLNAGAPVITVQTLLGHEKVDTTLGYARLYDGTVAADYYRAMGQVERLFTVAGSEWIYAPTPAELVALVDSLGGGTLNEAQRQTLQTLREGILALVPEINLAMNA
jgi:integrase/recombinase XerD